MSTKLTLSLEKSVIDRAKAFASERQISLSALVETLLLKVVSEAALPEASPGSAVKALTGILRLDSDHSSGDYRHYLEEKHQ
jgi:antitoxin component of RelBE/YafQ-DinJ toxin-antitoxin module